ncbi:MAG: hypothetical protein R3C68_19530, partial [Myxococcota bacterium]
MGFILLAESSAPPTWVTAVAKAIDALLETAPPGTIVEGQALRKRLGRGPRQAARQCKEDVACLAAIGQQANLDEIIYARMLGKNDKLVLHFMAITPRTKSIARKATLSFSSIEHIEERLRDQFENIFGKPRKINTADADLNALELVALPQQVSTPPTNKATEAPKKVSRRSRVPKDNSAPETKELPAKQPHQIRNTQAPPSHTARQQAENSGNRHALLYTGTVFGGVGVVALVTASVFGLKAKSLQSTANASSTTQPEALRLERSANSKAKKANIFFGMGS